jgi:hypothetical protein
VPVWNGYALVTKGYFAKTMSRPRDAKWLDEQDMAHVRGAPNHPQSVARAGFDKPNTGHHHLLADADLPPLGQPIPNDFRHLHFGAGETEVSRLREWRFFA